MSSSESGGGMSPHGAAASPAAAGREPAASPASPAAAGHEGGGMSQLEQQMARQVELARKSDHKSGLTAAEAEAQFKVFGKNELPEKVRNPLLMFLSYFTGPCRP